MDWYVVITIAAIVILIVIALIWVWVVKQVPSTPPPPSLATTGYGMRCSVNGTPVIPASGAPIDSIPQPCSPGLTCITTGTTTQCKKAIGTTCNSILECEPRAKVCAVVCSLTPSGGLNQPCGTGSTCSSPDLACTAGFCKLVNSATGCSQSSDCSAGSCQPSTDGLTLYCAPRYANGLQCSSGQDCISGYCDPSGPVKYCQDPGVTSGSQGAGCVYYHQEDPKCNSGLTCFVDIAEATSVTLGVCAPEQTSWPGIACSSMAGCIPPTTCFNGRCGLPQSPDSYLINSCLAGYTTGFCAPGYTCNSQGQCRGDGTVPEVGSQWSIVEWIPTSGTESGIGIWRLRLSGILAPASNGSFSSVNFNGQDLWLYLAIDGNYYLVTATQAIKLTITGTPGTTTIIQNVRFTIGGNIMITYGWTTAGVNLSRLYLQPIPSSWGVPGTEIGNLSYQVTYPGYTIGAPPPTNYSYYQYGDVSDRAVAGAKWIDVDDRPDQYGQIRALIVGTNGLLYRIVASIEMLNLITVDEASYLGLWDWIPLDTDRAIFYSSSKVLSSLDDYEYTAGTSNIQTSPSSGLSFPPDNWSLGILDWGSNSSPGSGITGTSIFYVADYGSRGGLVFRLYSEMQDLALPGYPNTGTKVAIGMLGEKRYYALTTTS